jgi:hypothetical protein
LGKQWATWEWFAKAVCIMSVNFYLEYLIYTQGPSLSKHALLGFFMALVCLSRSIARSLSLSRAL